jgi:hypothetical protein
MDPKAVQSTGVLQTKEVLDILGDKDAVANLALKNLDVARKPKSTRVS